MGLSKRLSLELNDIFQIKKAGSRHINASPGGYPAVCRQRK
jgi:hypothetical protein